MGNIVLPTAIMPVCGMAKTFLVQYAGNCHTKLRKVSRVQKAANIFAPRGAKHYGEISFISVRHIRISRQASLCIARRWNDIKFQKYADYARLKITGFWRYITSTKTGKTTRWRISRGSVITATFWFTITMWNERDLW
jgi:hypothetical protein